MKELADLIEEFSDEIFDETFGRADFEKKAVPEKVKEALREALTELNKYKEDFPESLKSACDLLLKFTATYGYGYPATTGGGKKPIKKEEEVAYWPSFDMGNGKEEIEKIKKRRSDKGDKFPSVTEQLFGTDDEE